MEVYFISKVAVLRWQPVNYALLKANMYEMKYLYHTVTQFMSHMKGEITVLERIRIELHIANTLQLLAMLIWGGFNPKHYDELPHQLQEITEKEIFDIYINIGLELNPQYTSFMPEDLFLQLGMIVSLIHILLPYNAYAEAWYEIEVYLKQLRRFSDVLLSKIEYLMGLLKITPEEPFVPFW